MRKLYRPNDTFDFGKYKGEKCDFVYTFHPEYFEYLINNQIDNYSQVFCIDMADYKDLHTCPFAQNYCSDSKYYNMINILEFDEETNAMGQTPISLRKYLTDYMNLYEIHYLNKPKEKKSYTFNANTIKKNELNLEIYKEERKNYC